MWNVKRRILVCWRDIPGCSGTHPQWWAWDHGCFGSSLKWPRQRGSNPDLCPSSLVLLITPPDAKAIRWLSLPPPCGFFLMTFLFAAPVMPNVVSALHREQPAKPQLPISMPSSRFHGICSGGTGCLITSTCLCWDRGERDAWPQRCWCGVGWESRVAWVSSWLPVWRWEG